MKFKGMGVHVTEMRLRAHLDGRGFNGVAVEVKHQQD